MRHALAAFLLVFGSDRLLATSEQVPLDPKLHFVEMVTGLDYPTTMTFVGPDDILLLQKNDGRVLRVLGGVLQPGQVLDVNVKNFSEQGLLGIARDPEFVINHYIYLLYTQSSTGADDSSSNGVNQGLGQRVYRYTWNGSALVNPLLILQLPPTIFGPHAGGIIAFGPDDKLYVYVGDGANQGQLQNVPNGPPPSDQGVIMRLNVDGSAPPDNPFYNLQNPLAPMNRYFAYGIRNGFGMAFDPVSGYLWESENGDTTYDEVNRIVRGMNGGHSAISGPDARDPQGVADLWSVPGSTYRDPEFSWLFPAAPTTVAFIDSPKMGCSRTHDLLVGAYGCRLIYGFDLNAARTSLVFSDPALADRVADNPDNRCEQEQSQITFAWGPQWNSDSTTDIKNGPDGLLYLLSYGHGTLRRLEPVPGALNDADQDQVDAACDCKPNDASAYALPVEVLRLRTKRTGGTLTLSWDTQNHSAGAGTTYALVSGYLADLRENAGFADACTLKAAAQAPPVVDTRPLAAGQGWFYLVRAQNSCGSGTFGSGSPVPDPRDALDATLPPACSP
jgi:aldose sugar dehydrogenase